MNDKSTIGEEEIVSATRRQLSWTHIKTLSYISDSLKRQFYLEMCAGVKVEGFGAVSASGNVGSDRCDNHELSGSVCIQGQVGLSVSGGAVFDVYWSDAHFKAGGEITGMVTASLSRCYTCNSKGCSLGTTQLCIEGDVSLHIYLWYWHMNHTLWNRGKCFEL